MTEAATTAEVIASLRDRLSGDTVITDTDIIESYRHDRALLLDAGAPIAVVRALTTADVVETLRVANHHHRPVVARGAGSGLSGGANAIDGCIVVSLAAMDRILAIDPVRMTATVQAGVINSELVNAAAAHGLWYPPDPASRTYSTIGGNIATNAGGACCLKYGVTGDHVAALVTVLADGTELATGTTSRKNSTGLDLTRLLVGSEGTLGIIVEATLRLQRLPSAASTVAATFDTAAAAGRAVSSILTQSQPSLLELMDCTTVAAVERVTRMGFEDVGALLLIQYNSRDASEQAQQCVRACADAGATYAAHTDDTDEGAQLLAARRMALPALEQLGATILDDVAVPQDLLTNLITRVEEIGHRLDLTIGTFGHAGDGNLHPTIVYDPADASSAERAHKAFDAIVGATLDLGGTLTGEHGVGTLKRPYLDRALGPQREIMHRIKLALDPNGILNPGKAI